MLDVAEMVPLGFWREYRRFVGLRGIRDVEWLGRVSDDDKARYFASACIGVKSRTKRSSRRTASAQRPFEYQNQARRPTIGTCCSGACSRWRPA